MQSIANQTIPEIDMTTRATKAVPADKTIDVSNVVQEATAKVETFVADTQKTVTEQFEKLSKGLEGLTSFGQENVESAPRSARTRRRRSRTA
jgi:hypothetical protein